MDHRIIQIRKSETNTSKNADAFIVSEKYLEVLISSLEVKFLYEKCKVPKMTKEMFNEIEVKLNNLFENFLTTSTEIGFDDIVALAVAYFNLGNIYTHKEVNLKTAEDYLMKYIELLKGQELHCKVILTAIQAHIDLNIVYIKSQQLEKCYPLLNEALELYLNYTKNEDEYPDPFHIDALYRSKEIINSKIQLTTLHTLTLKDNKISKRIKKMIKAAKYHLIKCIELLEGEELHYKVILTAIQARIVLNRVYMQLKQLENCYPLLDEALELYLNYTKDESEYPDPFNIDLKIMKNSIENHMFILWADASTNLALYFLYYDRFMEAKIHLAAANYMTMMYASILTDQDYSETCEDILQFSRTSTIEVWVIYENQYFFGDRFLSQVQTILYISKAYKYYAYFEGNKSKQVKVIKQQTEMLKNYISALSSKYSTLQEYQYYKHLYFELAITYSTLLNVTMTNEIAEGILERIVKLFPSEAEGIYFIDGKKIHTLNKKSIAMKVSNEDIQNVLDWLKIN
ncbi:uncharacterized protein LOC112638189 [Camponotus floridanus]|uniref:uncharacterized protein LOC112638189 n=1 Tax=Camponotus floridanus TaxID=104421 RepID=UPI000DC699CD|nr:uncharacterized protein LOC112638189 [Camponotus floridanus]